MLYCSFEPGLFIMQGLAPHERSKAFAVLKSLIVHKQMMDQDQVQIPMTKKYIEHIYAALEKIPIKDPPLQSELRNYIIATLAKMSSPLLPPANLDGTTIKPDFTSEWIDAETKDIWLDSLISAMFDEFTNKDMTLSVATWFRENLPASLQVTNPNLCEQLEAGKYCWDIPVLSEKLDWNELFCLSHGWPLGLGTTLIDSYAKKNLGVSLDQLAKRKATKFDPSCYHDILKETDVDIRAKIVETISQKAFNCLKPEHKDETIRRKLGTRRIYVKKTAPCVRLQYVMDDEAITYTLYSNEDHNRGL